MNMDVLLLNEINLDIHNPEIYRSLYQAFVKSTQHVSVLLNHNMDKASQSVKHGGVASAVLGTSVSRIIERDKDPGGRWTRITLAGKGYRKISFISAYQCCVPSDTIRDVARNTVWAQEYRCAIQRGHSGDVSPRELFVKDMKSYVENLINNGHLVVISMDANEHPGHSPGILTTLETLGLCDVHKVVHPGEIHPCTYERGTHCLDYVFISPELIPTLRGMKYHEPETLHSDHAGIEVRFCPGLLFGGNTESSELQHPNRTFRLRDSKIVTKYATHLANLVTQHNFVTKAKKLEERFRRQGATRKNVKALNDLDTEFGHMMRAAEKKSVRRFIGHFGAAWSVSVRDSGNALLRARRMFFQSKRLQQDTNLTYKAYKKAQEKHKETRRRAKEIREDFLHDKALEYAIKRNISGEKACKILKRLMESSRMYARIRRFKVRLPQLSSLLVKRNGGPEYETVVDTQEIFDMLVDRNVQVLKGGLGSKLVQSGILGEDGMSAVADQLLQGDLDGIELEGFEEAEINFLKVLARPLQLPEMNGAITPTEFQKVMNKTREATESSPSGRSYTHYKAILDAPDLVYLHSFFVVTCFRYGISLDRWSKVTQVMLLKKELPFYDKLRIIELFEADYNTGVKILMRRLLFHLHKYRQGPTSGIFGTIKGGSSIEAVLSRVWSYDYGRLTQTPLIALDNDAKSCYDRIPVSIAGICLRRLGVPDNIVSSYTAQLQSRERSIKIAQGLSNQTISQTEHGPLCGVGQGNAGGPATWHSILEALIAALQLTIPYEFTAVDPFHDEPFHLPITSYVDDCSSVINLTHSELVELERDGDITAKHSLLVDRIQQLTDTWVTLLRFSGGDIEPNKSHWLLADWTTKRGQVIPWTNAELEAQSGQALFRVKVCGGQVLPWKESDEPERYLGVRLCPSGNMSVELEYLRSESIAFGRKLSRIDVTSREAWLAYNVMWLPKVRYPLAATSFTRHECTSQINGPVEAQFLARIGVNRHFPKVVVHGPRAFGGLGLPNIYVEQGVAHIKWFISICRSSRSQLTPLLRILITLTQLESGWGTSIFMLPKHKLIQIIKYLTPSWLTLLLEFLCENDIRIQIADEWIPSLSPQWQGDSFLMEQLLDRLEWSPSDLRAFNHCRIYFMAITLSDIVDSTGRYIASSYRYGTERVPRPASDRWPYRSPPTDQMLKIWRRGLKSMYEFRGHGDDNIRVPLIPRVVATAHQSSASGFLRYLEAVPPHHWAFLGPDLKNPDKWEPLLMFCVTGETELLACSDGSVNNKKGSYAYTVRSLDNRELIHGEGWVFGTKVDSYRAELFGLAAILLCIHHVEQYLGTRYSIASLRTYCDNKTATELMQNLPLESSSFDYDRQCWDIISIVNILRPNITTSLSFEWVRGHQDTHLDVKDLELPAQLNVLMDQRAKALHDICADEREYIFTPEAKAVVMVDGRPVLGDLDRRVRDHILLPPLRKYITKKERWLNTTFDLVDWESFQAAMKRVPRFSLCTYSKFIHKWVCAAGRIAHYQDLDADDAGVVCVKCQCQVETIDHIFGCYLGTEMGQQVVNKFWSTVNAIGTHPVLVNVIKNVLFGKLLGGDGDAESIWDNIPIVRDLLYEQDQIGWLAMLRGRISGRWAGFQTDDNWGGWFIEALLKLGLGLWDARNKYIHEPDEPVQRHRDHRDVERLYRLKTQVPRRFHKLFPPIDEVLLKSRSQLNTWKRTITLLATIGPRENTITNYFPIVPNRPAIRTDMDIGMGEQPVPDDDLVELDQDIPAEFSSTPLIQRESEHVDDQDRGDCPGVLRRMPDVTRTNANVQQTMAGELSNFERRGTNTITTYFLPRGGNRNIVEAPVGRAETNLEPLVRGNRAFGASDGTTIRLELAGNTGAPSLRSHVRPQAPTRQRGSFLLHRSVSDIDLVRDTELALINRILDSNECDPLQVILQIPNGNRGPSEVRLASFQRLRPEKWFNDEVISGYMQVMNIKESIRCERLGSRRRSYYLNTFFFSQLMDENGTKRYRYENVKNMMRKLVPHGNIFMLDKLFIPINQTGIHWVMVIVDMRVKRPRYYDPAHGSGGNYYIPCIMQYLHDEFNRVTSLSLPTEEWTVQDMNGWDDQMYAVDPLVPLQTDSYSCGPMLLATTECLTEDGPMDYEQRDMDEYRLYVAAELLRHRRLEFDSALTFLN